MRPRNTRPDVRVLVARLRAAGVFVLLAGSVAQAQVAQGTAFTYQGRLQDGAAPASGPFDLQFILYDAAVGGSQVGPIVTREDVPVANGLFTVGLDFGAAFAGNKRWLEVSVRPGASTGVFTPLAPRQELTAAPVALSSASAPWTGVSGKPAGFADDLDNDTLAGLTCGPQQVVKRNAAGTWICAADANSGGTVTSVATGAGLTGGPITATGTLAVSFGGDGSAATVARSDHDHLGQSWLGAGDPGLSVATSTAGAAAIEGTSAATGASRGLAGFTVSTTGTGVYGGATAGTGVATGVVGETSSSQGRGVFGHTSSPTGATVGLRGHSESVGGYGVYANVSATTGTNYGVFGQVASVDGYAGYFSGRVHVSGTLSKSAGSFKIDHPLDPEHKYLYHSFVESPDMKNVYDGVVTTGPDGFATVRMPDWFGALNRDFRYQLTVIGDGVWARARVYREIADGAFVIQSDLPNVRVSWQVTGIRHDAYAERHRIPVEEDKPAEEQGTYLHPVEHGQPADLGIDARRRLP